MKFTVNELNEIKVIPGLVTSQDDTFITFPTSFVEDMAGFSIVPESGLQVAEFILDTTSPELLMFSLDMDTGILVLKFSKTVNVTTLNLAEFFIQSDPDPSVTTGSVPLVTTRASRNSASYELVLERKDSNSLKLNLCCNM